MKIMFMDESGDHSLDKIDSSYPMFVLAGCIYDFDYYSNVVEPEANKAFNILKMKIHKSPKTGQYLNFGLKIFP